jgi:predicted dehydrogenase
MSAAERPFRLGVLGAAGISPSAIVEPAKSLGVELACVSARDPDRARAFAETHGIPVVHGSYQEVIDDPTIDAIYNPLVNSEHVRWNLAAIAAGVPVLSEKPFAGNAADATVVSAAATTANVKVVDGFHYVYHPVAVRLLEVLESGELGELERVVATTRISDPGSSNPRWFFELAGGAIMDVGCYGLHANRIIGPWAGGEPTVVRAKGGVRDGQPLVDEWAEIELQFPSGVTGASRASMVHDQYELTIELIGSKGTAKIMNYVLPNMDDRLIVTVGGESREEHLGRRSSYTYQLERFVAHVREGMDMPTDHRDAVKTMELVDASYQALGLPVRPSSVPD